MIPHLVEVEHAVEILTSLEVEEIGTPARPLTEVHAAARGEGTAATLARFDIVLAMMRAEERADRGEL